MNQEIIDLRERPFLHYIKAFPKPFLKGMVFLLITNSFDAVWPLIFKNVLDGIQKQYPPSQLAITLILFFAVMASLAGTRFFWRWHFSRFHLEVQESLRGRLWDKVCRLSQNYFQKTPVGEIMSHLVQDVQSFRQGVGPGLLILFDGVSIVLLVLPLMLWLNWSWTLKTLSVLPLVPLIIWRLNLKIEKLYKTQQDRFAELTAFCQESVQGIRVIKSFAQENKRLEQFQKISREFLMDSQRLSFYEALFFPCMELGVSIAAIILIYIAQDDMLAGVATVGTFLAFHRYLSKLMWPLTAIGLGSTYIQKARASFERIKKLLDEKSLVIESQDARELREWKCIRFNKVSFVYPGQAQKALDQVSFEINHGEHLAIIGTVGSGKSTIVQLLLRLYPTTEGQIYIDEVPIEKFSLSSLRSQLTLVPQEVFLMSDTIINNLRYGNEMVTMEETQHILKQVQIFSEVQSLNEGVESMLGEKGVNLSGGQKQRLSLARGLVRSSSLLILDDVLSAVDVKTEHSLLEILNQEKKRQSLLIITHRMSGLKNVDRVLVLKSGKVMAFGPKASVAGLVEQINLESSSDDGHTDEDPNA